MTITISEVISNFSFMTILNAFNSLEKEENLIIYLNTPGGEVDSMNAIIDFINHNTERIELIGNWELSSAGFDIYMKSKCNKKLLQNTIGMAHYSSASVLVNENGELSDPYNQVRFDQLRSEKAKSLAFFKKLGLTANELKTIKAGQEQYFTYERMLELSSNSFKIK